MPLGVGNINWLNAVTSLKASATTKPSPSRCFVMTLPCFSGIWISAAGWCRIFGEDSQSASDKIVKKALQTRIRKRLHKNPDSEGLDSLKE